ncbi:MAG: L-aspartate oxidase [Dehalococcoidia bacterium]|nr:MAG: L-aspartate oxidase [Dehalococcoidia bacterium]
MKNYDYVIVGSGIAGLYCALLAREHGSVLLVTKGSIDDCNTRHAQGGIAAAIGVLDSPELHFKDTISAGAGLCNEEAVRILTGEAPDRIADLVKFGVPFDTFNGEIALTREAAHSRPRILHAGGDATGAQIETTLSRQIRLAQIPVLEHCLATHILKENGIVCGLETFDTRTCGSQQFGCRHLILATGGAGQLFKFTTNPEVATGDGIALAYRAGADIVDMEFFQFHPTALHLPGVEPFLISEAVRGEGGILRNAAGEAFMKTYTPQAELAPRDVVARSIVSEMGKTGADHVYIDVTHQPASITAARFPQIYHYCLEHGLDMARDMIPVAPAAHYMIGGIRVNTWGESSLPGLFAAGEVACTGVHGANRLASNSLLEVLVFGKRIIERSLEGGSQERADDWNGDMRAVMKQEATASGVPSPGRAALQQLLWENAGIVRNGKGLVRAAGVLAHWQRCLPQPGDRPSWELLNLIITGRLMTEAALMRLESRGAHFRLDYPKPDAAWHKHIVISSE